MKIKSIIGLKTENSTHIVKVNTIFGDALFMTEFECCKYALLTFVGPSDCPFLWEINQVGAWPFSQVVSAGLRDFLVSQENCRLPYLREKSKMA